MSETDWETLNSNCKSDPSPSDSKQYPIATYEEAMAALAAIPGTWLYLELKVDQTASQNRKIVEVIRANGLSSHTVVTSTQPQRLAAIEAIASDLRTMQFIHTAHPGGQSLQAPLGRGGRDGDPLEKLRAGAEAGRPVGGRLHPQRGSHLGKGTGLGRRQGPHRQAEGVLRSDWLAKNDCQAGRPANQAPGRIAFLLRLEQARVCRSKHGDLGSQTGG